MKILQVINALQRGGGAEKFLCDLAIAQAQISDIEVVVVNLFNPKGTDLVDKCVQRGIRVYTMCNRKYSVLGLYRLIKCIKKEKPDVIHVHLFPALYYAAFASLFLNISSKLMYTEHSTSNRRRNSKLFQCIDGWVYSKFNKIFAISEQVAISLKKHLPSINPIVVNNGININDIKAAKPVNIRKMLAIDEETFLVSMVARFCEIKDYNTVIKSLCYLPEKIHFICIGDGPTMNISRNLVESLSLSSRVHFLGLRKDVYSLLKSSDVVVLSSRHEGFSISMLEAMACGKPFIASAVPGIKDLVSDVAVLFEYKNERQLAVVLNKVYADTDYYSLLADKSLKFAQHYDINCVAKNYIKEYK